MLFVSAVGSIWQLRHKKELLGKNDPWHPLLKEHLVVLEGPHMNFHSNVGETRLLWILCVSSVDPFVPALWPKRSNATKNSLLSREIYLMLRPSFVNVSSEKGNGQCVCILGQQFIHTSSERVEYYLVELAYWARYFVSQKHPFAYLRQGMRSILQLEGPEAKQQIGLTLCS